MLLFIIAALAIALAAIIFALQNPATIAVNFLTWQFQDSLALILLVTLALGVIVGLLVCTPPLIRRNLRLSHQQRKLDDLAGTLQDRDRELLGQQRYAELLRRQTNDRLAVFDLTEPRTGLLAQQFVPQVCHALLSRMRLQAPDARYTSLHVLMINVDRVQSQDRQSELPMTEPVLQEIAQVLENKAYPESWLHCDGHRRFTCITPGLSDEAAADYGELLRATLSEIPVQLPNGSRVRLDISVGGTIADVTHPVDGASQLLQQAENALATAQERGGPNRFAWFGLGHSHLMWN